MSEGKTVSQMVGLWAIQLVIVMAAAKDFGWETQLVVELVER